MRSSTQVNRTHAVKSDYFDRIDTQEKAYWLGFLWADASISRTAKRASGPNRLRVTQKLSEKAHLERFRDLIGPDYELTPTHVGTATPGVQLDINCRPLCEALERLGYGPKNVRVHIPPIRKDLVRHFMRGYFDGDGCLSVYEQPMRGYIVPRQEWSVTGNRTLLSEMKAVLESDAGTTPTVKMKPYKRSPGTVSLRYGKKADIMLLHGYLYEDAAVYLESKHQKFVEFFSRCASKRIVPRRSTNSGTRTPAS